VLICRAVYRGRQCHDAVDIPNYIIRLQEINDIKPLVRCTYLLFLYLNYVLLNVLNKILFNFLKQIENKLKKCSNVCINYPYKSVTKILI